MTDPIHSAYEAANYTDAPVWEVTATVYVTAWDHKEAIDLAAENMLSAEWSVERAA